jgi:two-component system sensor histidine kinase TctE
MKGSIRRRLVLFLAVPLVILKLFDALYYYASIADARLADNARLAATARVLAVGIATTVGSLQVDLTARLASALGTDRDLHYDVVNSAGKRLGGDATLPVLPDVKDKNPVFGETTVGGRLTRLATYRVASPDGLVAITVGAWSPGTVQKLQLPVWRRLLWDFFELDTSLLLIWFGVHFGLRPLETLRREIDARSTDGLEPIRESNVPSELRPLLRSLNRLLELLKSSLHAQTQFVADAAHQLRTPIAGLVAQVDLLISDCQDSAVKERLLRLENGLRQVTRSANQLLTLSRATSGIDRLTRKVRMDLKDLVIDMADRIIDRAIRLGIELSADAQSAIVFADPPLMEELLGNLLDNALNHTPEGGEITIHSGCDGDRPVLILDDTGPGIALPERKRVLERFYRSPGSRGTGTGLGLAIVDEIARLYGATLSIETPPNGLGTRVRIQWLAPGAVTVPSPRRGRIRNSG